MFVKDKYISPTIDSRMVTIYPIMGESSVDTEVDDSSTDTPGSNSDDDLAKSMSGAFDSNSFSTDW